MLLMDNPNIVTTNEIRLKTSQTSLARSADARFNHLKGQCLKRTYVKSTAVSVLDCQQFWFQHWL